MSAEPPVFLTWVNRSLDRGARAMLLSSLGQADAAGQVALAPVSAGILGLGGVRAASVAGGLFALPAAALALTRAGAEPGAEAAMPAAELDSDRARR